MLWVLKNANKYVEEQLIEVFETMVEKCNVRNYKSNQRVFDYNRWRYNKEKPTHVALEYRLVVWRVGGIRKSQWSDNGLDERAASFLRDLLTIGHGLGFVGDTTDQRLWKRDAWTSGTLKTFNCMYEGKSQVFMEVRAFYNGNLHIRLNQKFALALNVEHGRLRGWITSPAQASEELKEPTAAAFFNTMLMLGKSSLKQLMA